MLNSKASDKKIPLSVWVSSRERDYLDLYAKQHRLNGRSEAFRNIIEEHNTMKADYATMKRDWEKYKTVLAQNPNVGKSQRSEMEVLEHTLPCKMMAYVEGKAVCADQDAPISNFLKVHLNEKICAICKIKKKEVQHKQLKSPKRRKSRPSNFLVRKPAKIYCKQDALRLNPLKCQAKCKICQLHHSRTWGECQQKYQQEQTSTQ